MVPEIALTPSVAALFRAAFGDARRHPAQRAVRRRAPRSVAAHPPRRRGRRRRHAVGRIRAADTARPDHRGRGARQLVQAGRDAALSRPRRRHRARPQASEALVVLGSATPSMESYQNAVSGKYASATLERRVLDRPLASVRLVNMREEYADAGPGRRHQPRACRGDRRSPGAPGAGARPAQPPRLRDGGVLPAVRRHVRVPELHVSLTVHTARHGLAGALPLLQLLDDVPTACRKCAAPYLEQAGFGTEKVEQQLRERFPEARIGRVDRDSVRRKGALDRRFCRASRPASSTCWSARR